MIEEWRVSIANADAADWVTVAAYLLAAWLAVRAAMQATVLQEVRERLFWRAAAMLLVLLGVNELLDLQTLLTALVRDHAKANGWYGQHRQVQYAFVLALGAVGALLGLAAVWFTRRMHATVSLALAGLVFIGVFVLIRAASFHHLDDLLGRGWPVFNWGSLQELAGILIVGVAALLYGRAEAPSSREIS